MARIRSIKPEFPQSETIGGLSRDARLLFIQLWTIVDDEGRTRAASRMLASLLYPYDDDAKDLIEGWLAELHRTGCIIRYEVEGSSYIEIGNWSKHQKIDHPSKSKIPSPRDGSEIFAKPREASRSLAPDLGPRIGSRKELLPETSSGGLDLAAQAERPSNPAGPKEPPGFAEFYEQYPKHVDRQGAARKYAAAIKSGVSREKLLFGASRYAGFCSSKRLEAKYIKSPEVWLNKGCWDDDLSGPTIAVARSPTEPTPARWRELVAYFCREGFWPDPVAGFGPPPDSTSCRCPKEILREFVRADPPLPPRALRLLEGIAA